jgi:hypothetical protein
MSGRCVEVVVVVYVVLLYGASVGGMTAGSLFTKAILNAILDALLLSSDLLFTSIEADVVLGIKRVVRVSANRQSKPHHNRNSINLLLKLLPNLLNHLIPAQTRILLLDFRQPSLLKRLISSRKPPLRMPINLHII